ncbi:unnamed protein product [Caenorhabditis bovis]|uniref:T-cell immunomodulatory protein TIP C2 domain-containing protein n=1 Tax=Caenorhabditis bovis TaxID=2654633 RepID=A0A8S1EPY4_9PELO|nr:unnamed protein product [Caenorhabditis bovis]
MRWLLRICVLLTICVFRNEARLNKQAAEVTGRVCAFGDFNADRNTDILVSRGGNLTILLQDDKLLDLIAGKFINSTSWKIADEELGDDLECSVGDFNGDSRLDVLTSIRISDKEYDHTLWTSTDVDNTEVFRSFHIGVLGQHAMAIDVTNDGWYDIVGFWPNGTFFCTKVGKSGSIIPVVDDCSTDFRNMPNSMNFYEGMPHLFMDLNEDLRAEVVFMTKDEEDGSLVMSVWQEQKIGWMFKDWVPKLSSAQYAYIGAPFGMDFDADGRMDILVPVCREAECRHVTSLAMYSHNRGWTNVAIDLQELEVEVEPYSRVIFRVGDFSLDGYPDLVAIAVNKNRNQPTYTPKVIENVECKNCEKNGTRKFEIKKMEFIQPKNMALGTAKMAAFFDLEEDGSLDILVEYVFDGVTRFGFIYCPDKGDTTFLKVQVFTGVCSDRCNPKSNELGSSISFAGACAYFSMSDGWGGSAKSVSCQVPTSSHRSLFLPFLLFGLGRSPNFVDEVNIGIPKLADRREEWRHTLKQIVPNSRIIVLPPSEQNPHWLSRLYVTPSQLIAQSLLVIASVCLMLLAVVVFLHYREKKEDRYERQQQSHRFHFDAM